MKYRIIQKRGHGGYWIQYKTLFGWKDYDKYGLGNHWYAELEWAKREIEQLTTEPEIVTIKEY